MGFQGWLQLMQQRVWADDNAGTAMFSYQGSEQAFLKSLRDNKVITLT